MEVEETKSLCVCCLQYGTFIEPGLYEDYQDIIESISHAYKIPQKASVPLFICWMCKAMLAKVKRFKLQVEESLCMLEHHMSQELQQPEQLHLRSINHSLQLGISDVELVSVQSEYVDKWDGGETTQKDQEEFSCEPIKVEDVETDGVSRDTILKSEVTYDEAGAVSNDSGGSEGGEVKVEWASGVRSSQKRRGGVAVGKRAGRDGRVVRVVLSAAQVAREREREARSPRYLALPHKCTSCLLGFEHADTLRYHQRLRHAKGERRMRCETCQATLSSAASYRLHQYRHTVRWECARCGRRALTRRTIQRHYDETHNRALDTTSTAFNCDICNHTAQSHRALRYHKEKHRQRPQCPHCGNTFINESTLRRHICVVHALECGEESQRQYECDLCGRRYKSRSGLVTHLHCHADGSDASAPTQLYCTPCRTHFKTRYTLAAHLANHRAHVTPTDYKYTCEECSRRFLHKHQLARHIKWQHLNSTQHICDLCNKRFADDKCLRRHKDAVHEKLRPPRDKICQYCARAFTTVRYLETHVRTHTGERPLVCAVCAATFAHSAALYTHNKLVHKLRPARERARATALTANATATATTANANSGTTVAIATAIDT